jgi:hypothetical protein
MNLDKSYPLKTRLTVFVWLLTSICSFGQTNRNITIEDSLVVTKSKQIYVEDNNATHLPTTLTLKSNAVGWLMAMVNFGVEYEFSPHWSFELPVYYSCWDYFKKDYKFRIFAIIPEFKYYFGAAEHCGLGAHVGVAYYNWAFGGDNRYQTHQHKCPIGGGGLSFIYRKRFGSAQRWGFECSVGFGAYINEYDRYPLTPCACDPTNTSSFVDGTCTCRFPTKFRKTFIGCDKLSLSITYNFDFNKNKKWNGASHH